MGGHLGERLPEPVLARIRSDFLAVCDYIFLDIASCAPLSNSVHAAISSHISDLEYGFDKSKAMEWVERARAQYAELINANPVDIALTKNVSEGLNLVASAIDWRRGDNVVVCPALEHLNNRYLWHNLAQQKGVELRLISPTDNAYPLERMIAAIDSRTRLVTLSSVSYVPGFLTPLEEIADVCRRRDILLLIDAAQSVGPLHTDVQAMGAGALAVTTQKGLLGVYGLGFLYVDPRWSERLTPQHVARFGVDEKKMTHAGVMQEPIQWRIGARRFDLGNHNLIAAIAASESLKLLLSVGTKAIQDHTVGLATELSGGLERLGMPVCKPSTQSEQAHVVALGSVLPAPNGAEFKTLLAMHEYLTQNCVRSSWRNGILRFSFHLFNSDEDIEAVLKLVQKFTQTARQ